MKQNVKEPFLLISIQSVSGSDITPRETGRYLVPLEEAMTFVQFNRKGHNVVHAQIIWRELGQSTKNLRNAALSKANWNTWKYRIYDHSGDFDSGFVSNFCSLDPSFYGTLDVEVGAEFFAHEPSEREKHWVNKWFKYPAVDQCEFRKRRLVAYTIQPPVMFVLVAIFTIVRAAYAIFVLFFGVRRVNLRSIIPSWESLPSVCPDISSAFDFLEPKYNRFFTDKDRKPRSRMLLLVYPPFVTVVALVLYYAMHFHAWDRVAVAAAIIVGITTAVWFLNKFGERIFGTTDAERLAEMRRLYEEELQAITCTGAPLTASLAALPASRRTVRLRFLDAKASVCKPFVQG